MTWYAAHVITSVRPIVPDQEPISAFENIILVEANDPKEACAKAKLFAAEEPGSDEGLTINDKPARTIVEGIRKVVIVSNPWPLEQEADRPIAGTEISYSRLELKDDQALQDLVSGKEVTIRYID